MARRITILAFGSRGDVQPFCVLGRALQNAGYDVELCAPEPYAPFVQSFGLTLRPIGSSLVQMKDSEITAALLRGGLDRLRALPALYAECRRVMADFLAECWDATENSDLVVSMAATFFAAEFARMRGIASVKAILQPVIPTSKHATTLIGGADRGPLLNRLSFPLIRAWAPLVLSGLRGFRRKTGRKLRLGILPDAVLFGASWSLNLVAFSPAISPDPGDWPIQTKITGPWLQQPETSEPLSPDLQAFLANGPAVYFGFGSMQWNLEETSPVLFDAIARWGGRAVLSVGWGGLREPAHLPSHVIFTGPVEHSVLFPSLSGVVHHGGAGTTAEGLRNARPTLVLPLHWDQHYWGRRVAELAAGPPPMPLAKIDATELAERLADLVGNEKYRAGAAAVAHAMQREPGVAGAVNEIAKILPC
jgi:sterol 3beta-glucosyltransferase